MRNKFLVSAALVMPVLAAAADFSECHDYSKAFINSGSEPVVSENGLRADWIFNGQKIGCRVDESGRFVSLITSSGEMMRSELVKVRGPSAGKIEYGAAEDDAFVRAGIDKIKRIVKDPDAVQFRELFISDNALKTLCGEVNGKNAYGAYVGYRRFYYTGRTSLDEIEKPGDSVFAGMYPKMCGSVRKTVAQPDSEVKSAKAEGSVADEIAKLDALRKQGVLTKQEFETQKQKLLAR